MPWVTGRETLPALAPDLEWRGRDASLFPGIWWSVNTADGAAWADGAIDIRVCWIDVNGLPVFDDADQVTIEPAHQDQLPFPGDRSLAMVSMGTADQTKAWRAQRIDMAPRGLVSVRLTGAVAIGADRALIQFWQAPP